MLSCVYMDIYVYIYIYICIHTLLLTSPHQLAVADDADEAEIPAAPLIAQYLIFA